jgi:hypothetical protein
MALISGLALIAFAIGLLVVARPRGGEPARFLRYWPVGQAYVMGVIIAAVTGITMVISSAAG